ncbi:MAG: Eco57I restriction-modification methylase domain-containing protein [Candidatus Promineifilaceae bacterium]
MNPAAASTLITQTFDSRFDEQTFENFVSNLFNQVDRSKAFGYRVGNIIPQAFRGHISSYRRPFIYKDPNGDRLDVLIVRLDKSHSLDRARTMQRNFAAWYLKQDHAETVEAALIAFYHEAVADWRFSLVRLEYAFGEEGIDEKLTPARRYSFLVGPTEPTHTAESQLRPFLLEDGINPTIDALAQAFQIEVISRRFFEEYKELFLQLVEHIEALLQKNKRLAEDFQRAEIVVSNFAKKLLGQIVFLYFVQKKGWLGVTPGQAWGSGPKDFLRRLFAKQNGVSYSNFFNDVLEPLFYEALAIRRDGDLFRMSGYTCQIPFLNGGLFEPMGGYDWQHTQLLLPNSLFSNRANEADQSGTGILDVFDRYNFTVREEEPLEKEVAVDPEMLGKVFQELLEVHERKSKGAIYTPREIVHYMCQESLINYLDTSVNLVKTLITHESPVQSSLFGASIPPQETTHTMTRVERVPREEIAILVRQGALALQQDAAKEAGLKSGDYVLPPGVREFARELDKALATIKLCDPAIGSGAFPVGMLHEIVQARLALDTQLKQKPTPYALKRHAIQESIYGVDIDAGAVEIAKLRLWLSLVVDEESYEDIQPLPNLDYKIVCGNSLLGVEKNLLNLHLFNRLDSLKQQYFAETHRHEKARLKTQIDQLIELLTGDKTAFDFEVYFHEVFAGQSGFDVVIGNPPYVRQELLQPLKPILQKWHKEVYTGIADLYVYFYSQGIKILREYGVLTFICSNKYFRAGYGQKLRTFLTSKTIIHQLIDFGDAPVFDATAYPSIILVQKGVSHDHHLAAFNWEPGPPISDFAAIYRARHFTMPQNSLTSDGWRLEQGDVRTVLEKMRRAGQPLGEYVKGRFYRGVVTGFNEAFVVDRTTRDRLIAEHPSSADILKPFLRGRDVKRWQAQSPDLWLIFTRRGINIDTYPAIKKYLLAYKERLMPQPKNWNGPWQGRKAGSYEWYEIQDNIAYWQEFEQPQNCYGET